MEVPILFIVFNRPEPTQLIFDKIRSLKPTTLYISSDGPRIGNEADAENISKVRSVFEGVDWDCKVHTLYREENLGCGRGPSEGIKWFFSEVEYGIVLEDDCLPTTSFFGFCEQMLKKYKHDKSVFHISGNNWYPESEEIKEDYYFTNHAGMWGWASWADRWSNYDFRLTNNIPQVREKVKTQFQSKGIITYFNEKLNVVERLDDFDFWDYQWACTIYLNNAVSISPKRNLVSNIGFDEMATHTQEFDVKVTNKTGFEIDTANIIHPTIIKTNNKIDEAIFRYLGVYTPSFTYRLIRKIKSFLA